MVSCTASELMCTELMRGAVTDQECYSRESGLYPGIGIWSGLGFGML